MRVPITNENAMPLYVAGLMIPPGETRHFEEDQLPPEYRATEVISDEAALPDSRQDSLSELLSGTVDAVKTGIPALSDDEIDRLEALEVEGRARKGVFEAIAAEKLARAEAKAAESDPNAAGAEAGQGGGE